MFLRCKTCSSINTTRRDEDTRQRDFSLAYTCLAREECGRFAARVGRTGYAQAIGYSLLDLAAREFLKVTARDDT